MTEDEALATIRKAVELLPELEAYSDTRKGWTKHLAILGWSDFQTIMLALNAIKPSGPLVAVPRKMMEHLAQVYCDARCPSVWKTSRGQPHVKECQELHAMIKETESCR